ncbi:uncharacterized protein VTP21DRAFT_5476 [Calcarisporiella thermophila]|uniref:uncharacterized protein n=1 Tax=Calcarisporiella thermophila TaxID=911321 RepID=UPI003743D50A
MLVKPTQTKPRRFTLLALIAAISTIAGLITYWYRRRSMRRLLGGGGDSQSGQNQSNRGTEHVNGNVRTEESFGSRLLGALNTPRRRKPITISVKNTVLWNPSPDPTTPNYAFLENAVPILRHLSQYYSVHLIATTSSQMERDQITSLLTSAGLFSKGGLDRRRLLFCESEQGKVHIVRHLESAVHIEGGVGNAEAANGEGGSSSRDGGVIAQLSQHVGRVVWVKRSSSDSRTGSAEGGERRNVEVVTRLVESLFLKETGFKLQAQTTAAGRK